MVGGGSGGHHEAGTEERRLQDRLTLIYDTRSRELYAESA